MSDMIGRLGLTVSLGTAGTLLASAISPAQTTRTVEQIRKVEAPVAPAPVAVAERTAADYLAFETERLRPYLRVEYHFLRAVCSLTPYQRTRIARAAEREYKDAVAQYVKLTWSPQLRRAGESPRARPDPRTLIRESLARAAKPCLDADQVARYREELAQRAEAQKQMLIDCFISGIDEDLLLSDDQRRRITEIVISSWNDAWLPLESTMPNIDRHFFRIPRQQIIPFLSEDQKKLWEMNSSRPVPLVLIRALPSFAANFPEDDELTAAREAAADDAEEVP